MQQQQQQRTVVFPWSAGADAAREQCVEAPAGVQRSRKGHSCHAPTWASTHRLRMWLWLPCSAISSCGRTVTLAMADGNAG